MFFFELLFFYISFAISFYVSLTNLFSIILFPYLLITQDIQDQGEARFDSTDTGNGLKVILWLRNPSSFPNRLSQIQVLTSKITQVCQDIHDIKLRWLLITQLDGESNDITTCVQTNQSDHKNTWGLNRSRPETLDIHEGCAEDGNDYIYNTPNLLEHNSWNNWEDHETCPPQPQPIPSGMTPEPRPFPDPSEASKKSSLPPASLLSLLKKDNNEPNTLSIYMERPRYSWNLSGPLYPFHS